MRIAAPGDERTPPETRASSYSTCLRHRPKNMLLLESTMRENEMRAALLRRWRRILSRLVFYLLLATAIGWTLNRIGKSMQRSPRAAGFGRGLIQGALMPMAMPNLLVGNDVAIYSQNNTGLTYKLGYTVGVNACGAIFFGFFFWRVRRWRNEAFPKSPVGKSL